jgi:hypothetical protein
VPAHLAFKLNPQNLYISQIFEQVFALFYFLEERRGVALAELYKKEGCGLGLTVIGNFKKNVYLSLFIN